MPWLVFLAIDAGKLALLMEGGALSFDEQKPVAGSFDFIFCCIVI